YIVSSSAVFIVSIRTCKFARFCYGTRANRGQRQGYNSKHCSRSLLALTFFKFYFRLRPRSFTFIV
ncbi:unnamed protein product, partial [Amoebophrya sp. A25]